MKTEIIVEKIDGTTPPTGTVKKNRKEDWFHSSVIAINLQEQVLSGFSREIVTIRWYHRPKSTLWYCCVWIYMPLVTGGRSKNLVGAGSSPIMYASNAFNMSLKRALESTGVFMKTEESHMIDLSPEQFAMHAIKAIFAYWRQEGMTIPRYTLVNAHA